MNFPNDPTVDANLVSLPKGKYSAEQLRSANILRLGVPFIINRNGYETIYIPLDVGENGYQFLNVSTNQIEPESVVLSGRFKARQPNQIEFQSARNLNPNIKDLSSAIKYIKKHPHASLRIAETVVTGATSDYDGSSVRERTLKSAFVETKTKIYRSRKVHNALAIGYEYSNKTRVKGFLTVEAIDDTIKEIQRISTLPSEEARVKARAEMVRHQAEVMDVANRIRRSDSEDIIETLKRLKNRTPEDRIKYTIEGRLAGKTKVDISVVKETELASRLQEELGKKGFSQRLARIYQRPDYRGPSEIILTEENVKNATNASLAFEQLNRDWKNVRRIYTPEALANRIKYQAISGDRAPKYYASQKQEAKMLDAVYGTHVANHPAVATPGWSGMIRRHGSRQLGALLYGKAEAPASKILRENTTLRNISQALQAASASKVVDAYGNIYIGSEDQYVRMLGTIDKTAISQALKAETVSNEVRLRIESNLIGEAPSRIMYGEGFGNIGKRYPKAVTNSTGLFSIVGSMVGAYFYQSMLRHQYRQLEEIYKFFHEPGEIIEAKQHSSLETSVRRILNSDFGSKFSYVTSFVKGAFGRSYSQAVRRIFKEDGLDAIRQTLDPVSAVTKIREWRTVLADRVKRATDKTFGDKANDLIKEALDPLTRYWKSATITAGSMLMISKIGSSPEEAVSRQKKNKPDKATPQGKELQSNFVFPHEFYQSQTNAINRAIIGFGSPFLGLIDTIKAIGVLDVVRSKGVTQIVEDIIRKGGSRIVGSKKLGIGMQNTGPFRTLRSWSSSPIASDIQMSTAAAEVVQETSREATRLIGDRMVRRAAISKDKLPDMITGSLQIKRELKVPYSRFEETKQMPLDNVVMPHRWNYNPNIRLPEKKVVTKEIPAADTSSGDILPTSTPPVKNYSVTNRRTQNDIMAIAAPRAIASHQPMRSHSSLLARSMDSYVDPRINHTRPRPVRLPDRVQNTRKQSIYPDIGEAVNKVMLSGAGTKNRYSNYSRGVNERIMEELSKED